MDKTENPDGGRSQWGATPFGSDKNTGSHIQPAGPAAKPLPGEQPDPRSC